MKPCIFLDEAGISALEPVSVVVAIIVRDEHDLANIEKALDHVRRHVPAHLRKGFIFHATDLFHRKKGTAAAQIGDEERSAILEELVALPRELTMPMAIAYTTRSEPSSEATRKGRAMIEHLATFGSCLLSAAKWSNKFASDATMGIVAEDCPPMRGMLMKILDDLRSDEAPPEWIDGVSLDCLAGPVVFAKKGASLPLQVADACAFAIRRYLSGGKHGPALLGCLTGGVVSKMDWQAPAGHALLLWRWRCVGAFYGIPSNPYPFGP